MSDERDRPRGKRPDESAAGAAKLGDPRSGDRSVRLEDELGQDASRRANPAPLVDRLDREQRRAVRAEARLAEIESALRREIEGSADGVVSAQAMRSVLEAVHNRVVSLEDEVRASEKEMLALVAAQRRNRGSLAVDDSDLARGLEQARRELRDAVAADGRGLFELTRQRLEFEVEMDRLQSIVTSRDNVCDGLAAELEQGARVAAEVTSRLADLSWGRVAPARTAVKQDARVAALRRDLESEQAQLRQVQRSLETARAELKVAHRGVSDIEDETGAKVSRLQEQVAELRAERDRLAGEIETAVAAAADDARRARQVLQVLDEERAGRVRLRERASGLEARVADLEREIGLSGSGCDEAMRAKLTEVEHDLEQTESERVVLAERVSLLQATLSAEEANRRRGLGGKSPPPPRPSGDNVVALPSGRVAPPSPEPAVAGPPESAIDAETDRLIRERESDIEELAKRWRELQGAYRDAVAEFDDVRERRDRLMRTLGAAPPADIDRPLPGAMPSGRDSHESPETGENAGDLAKNHTTVHATADATVDAADDPGDDPPAAPPRGRASEGGGDVRRDPPRDSRPDLAGRPRGDVSTVRQRDPRPWVLVHLDDEDCLDAGRRLATAAGAGFTSAREPQIPSGAEVIVATNLVARQLDPFQALATLAGDGDIVRSLIYTARADRGRVWGAVDVFPPPFDADGCATALSARYPRLCRALAVGESVERMSRLREVLGRSHCSTAVAFGLEQARELIPLVRPEYVLIDLALPRCGGVELLSDLCAVGELPTALGVTWSRPIDAGPVAAFLEQRLGDTPLDRECLLEALLAMVGNGPAGAAVEPPADR